MVREMCPPVPLRGMKSGLTKMTQCTNTFIETPPRNSFVSCLRSKKRAFFSLATVAFLLAGCDKDLDAQPPQETFQDCILSRITSAANEDVATMVREQCAIKHQVEIPKAALSKISVNIDRDEDSRLYLFVIRNGNDDWIITEIESLESPDPKSMPMEHHRKSYYIGPLRAELTGPSVAVERENTTTYSWDVSRAWGIPAHTNKEKN